MRNAAIALPTAAVIGMTAFAAAPTAASAAPAPKPAKHAHAKGLPVSDAQYHRYHLKDRELKEIKQAKRWARSAKSRSVIRCESGGDYRMIDGPYHGAWQFLTGTWLGAGGGRYSHNANGAPKFAQDHVAWKLWKRSGWGPWSCA